MGDIPGLDDQRAREGLAARAVALVELGRTDAEVTADIASYLARHHMLTDATVREVVAAIDRLVRLDAVPDQELEAMRRAKALLEEYAIHLEQQG